MSLLGTLGLRTATRLVQMPPVPSLPPGRLVELPGRGSTYLVDTGPVAAHAHNADHGRGGPEPEGPPPAGPDAPVVVLLHALACTGLLTWYPCLDALRRRYRVVLFDQRWHGEGIRSRTFRLADCADDVAAVADVLGLDRVVCAGYSMGSLVSQLTWHRHRDRVSGLVLGASTTHFPPGSGSVPMQSLGLGLAALSRRAAKSGVQEALDETADERWAWRQFRDTRPSEIAAVGTALIRFDSRRWIGGVDVPTSVVLTTRDRVMPPPRQRALAHRITGATVYEVDGGHASCVLAADRFRPAMLAATASVTNRIRDRRAASQRPADVRPR